MPCPLGERSNGWPPEDAAASLDGLLEPFGGGGAFGDVGLSDDDRPLCSPRNSSFSSPDEAAAVLCSKSDIPLAAELSEKMASLEGVPSSQNDDLQIVE